jgi:hypothetical protein
LIRTQRNSLKALAEKRWKSIGKNDNNTRIRHELGNPGLRALRQLAEDSIRNVV